MRKSVWGPIIWLFLHTFSIKIKEKKFDENLILIKEFIYSICDNLPCPYCSSHARGYLNKVNFKNIKKKDDLIKVLWSMHNEVNVNTKKPKLEYNDMLKLYENNNFEKCAIIFFRSFQNMIYGERMMLYTFQRRKFIKKYLPIIKDNIDWFN